ncbi:terpene synthase family protein [Nocardia goodfellowii]|uniref:Terpene synthase n=1 Tax=Nocardia goodfellowii TaxID=882446 RepID=A0ABS4QIP2_9NOCA|nr:hypothetical protein [Nocardia goodfellowii]MBP2191581.1 hypothetical protein [Nocardia goodfellowii]
MPGALEFDVPFTSRISPDVNQAREHGLSWLRSYGLLSNTVDADNFLAFRLADAAATCWPDARGADLCVATDFSGWTRIADDMFIAQPAAALYSVTEVERLLETALGNEPLVSENHCPTPMTSSFADLWTRLTDGMSPTWQRRIADALLRFFAACRTEVDNRRRERVPTVADYRRLRRDSVFTDALFALTERTSHLEAPAILFANPRFLALRDAGTDLAAFINDLYSLDIEESQGDCHNLALVLQHELDCSRDDAIARVQHEITALTRDFLALEAGLPALYRSLNLSAPQQKAASHYVDGIRNIVATTRDWSSTSSCYDVPSLDGQISD